MAFDKKFDNRGSQGRGNSNDWKPKEPIKVPKFENEWITDGIRKDAILYAEALGGRLEQMKFTTSQIRNFYGELTRMKYGNLDLEKGAFHLLHPKLAYAAGRASKKGNDSGAGLFKTEIMKAHDAVAIDSDGHEHRFKHFCELCEAILAFHKAAGGVDN
jgi:CRISPR-associated protein Csm2